MISLTCEVLYYLTGTLINPRVALFTLKDCYAHEFSSQFLVN